MTSSRSQTVIGDDKFHDIIRSRMPDTQKETVDVLGKLKSTYIECGRDRLLRKNFKEFQEVVLATKEGTNTRVEGDAFYLVGESGSGKTRTVRHLLEANELLQLIPTQTGTIHLWASISLHGPGTLKTLGMKILKATGYVGKGLEEGTLWAMLPEHLHSVGVLLIHIDETQHMLRYSEKNREELSNALKSVMNDEVWPVSFLLSGMPRTTELIRRDTQTERRQFVFDLPRVDVEEERVLIERIIERMCEVAKVGVGEVIDSDIPDRIAHAARYQYGRISQVVFAALHAALNEKLEGKKVLTRDHFAQAYINHSHARGYDDVNPFLVDDWMELDEGLFIFDRSHHDA